MSAFLAGLPLLANGYSIIWTDPEEGQPRLPGWDRFRTEPMTPDEVRHWARKHPNAGLAVVGGYLDLAPIDFDGWLPEQKEAFLRVMPRPRVARFGTKGFGGFWRGKVQGRNFMLPPDPVTGKRRPLIEVKSAGVLTIPPTLHRKTRRPYVYMRCTEGIAAETLFEVRPEEHPKITEQHMLDLVQVMAPWCPIETYEPPKPIRSSWGYSADLMTRRYQGKARSELEVVRDQVANCGGSNGALAAKARRLMKWVHHGYLSHQEAEAALMQGCEAGGLIAKDGRKGCLATIRSGFKRSAKDPLPELEDRPGPSRYTPGFVVERQPRHSFAEQRQQA